MRDRQNSGIQNLTDSNAAGQNARVHVVKLCVGADSVDDLRHWQEGQIAARLAEGARPLPHCGTRSFPKRRAEILAGGSLYWVIRGIILVRQRILDIGDVVDDHGPRCGFFLDPVLHATAPMPRRAFQGWRYLPSEDAPCDLDDVAGGAGELPADMRRALLTAGVW